ncbi:MAG: fibronectin type III domain-containing protein, partial [Pseudoalteromonas sp.]|nr:fibronectin type III domain-containing protein [Pseudoalteromonas sp.]
MLFVHFPSATHPSEPRNVTISDVTTTSAVLRWAHPKDKSEHVNSYSILFRQDDALNQTWRTVNTR